MMPTRKPKTLDGNSIRELEKKMHRIRGEMGALPAKRRKVNVESPEAAATAVADLQVTAKAAEVAGGSQSL